MGSIRVARRADGSALRIALVTVAERGYAAGEIGRYLKKTSGLTGRGQFPT